MAVVLARDDDPLVAARASFHVYNTYDDVDRLIAALQKAREVFAL